MKKVIYTILFSIILTGVIAGIYFYKSINYLETYQSPDGNFELIIKRNRSIFTPTMPGDGGLGSLPVEVVLKSTDGKVIGTSNSNNDCGILMDSLSIEWDLENNQVWYGKAKTINLTTGKVEC